MGFPQNCQTFWKSPRADGDRHGCSCGMCQIDGKSQEVKTIQADQVASVVPKLSKPVVTQAEGWWPSTESFKGNKNWQFVLFVKAGPRISAIWFQQITENYFRLDRSVKLQGEKFDGRSSEAHRNQVTKWKTRWQLCTDHCANITLHKTF